MEFKSGDLHYAIQHFTLTGTITKSQSGAWNAAVTFTDDFNFDCLRMKYTQGVDGFFKSFSFSNAANDFGYFAYHGGILDAFHIEFEFEISGN